MTVTRCVCFNRRFIELKKIAQEHDIHTIEELQRFVKFGLNCQRCHPYVKKMLETGETFFDVIHVEPDNRSGD